MQESIEAISQLNYRYAKTYPQCPHFYIIRQDLSPKNKVFFDTISEYIEKEGEGVYIKYRYTTPYKYYNFRGYKYWVIENVLNRTPLSVGQLRKDLENIDVKEDMRDIVSNHINQNLIYLFPEGENA